MKYNYRRFRDTGNKRVVVFVFTLVLSIVWVSNIMAQSSSLLQSSEATISLDSTQQVIRGFGAANIVGWRPDMNSAEIEKAFGTGEGQLGFSILRLRIPPQRNQWDINLPSAKAAHSMGVKVFASPWSPPASMKTNNSTVGGRLKDNSYADFAQYLNDFSEYMADNGAPLYAVSVQNEPDIEVGYESCDYTPDQMLRFVRDYADSIDTRLIAPESYQFRRVMSDPILNDSEAASKLDIVGAHIYGGGLSPYPLAEEKGKEVWMTEHYTDSQHSANRWPMALDVGTEIHNNMVSGYSAYIWWYIVRYYGPIGDGEKSASYPNENFADKGEITKRGYIMSQYSRFIRPGYVRVDAPATPQRQLRVTAYKGDSKVVIVVVNTDSSPAEQTFALKDGTVTQFTPYVTSETKNAEEGSVMAVSDNQFTATLEAESVTTFVSDEITTGIGEENGVIPGSYKLKQNYPNPFNPTTTISFELPKTDHVTLQVSDILGRTVATLIDRKVSAGKHEVRFDASNLSSGVYFYRLNAGNFLQTRRMTLIK